ncbi:LOW QUALITY PROTEIN: neuronal pentraxin receptor [Phascolarctos cinereus]|uniref:LOW QUALITY PROTEIN: neuronal pentraxin receptor n=1 Tax=Phascolarctos cinereus TaxID=38626 RepID=A0A6P5JYS7_PHACI|nr:LOW QUALITY PROTEIN: neuronal pentraxin receptor [Phascolarctos cinereus]
MGARYPPREVWKRQSHTITGAKGMDIQIALYWPEHKAPLAQCWADWCRWGFEVQLGFSATRSQHPCEIRRLKVGHRDHQGSRLRGRKAGVRGWPRWAGGPGSPSRAQSCGGGSGSSSGTSSSGTSRSSNNSSRSVSPLTPQPACTGPCGPPAARATLKFLAVLLAAGMLAFLGAIVCIIASVHPAASPARAPSGAAADNDSSAGAAALLPPGPEQSLSALHGPGSSAGPTSSPCPAAAASCWPAPPLQHPLLFSRFLCTPLAAECPTSSDGSAVQGDGPGSGQQQQQQRQREEELLALQSTAEQLRQTALQQKARIRADQEAIRELTGKLGRCESGLQLPFQDTAPPGRQDTMSDGPAWDSPAVVRELEEAVRALKERIEKIEQELPVHGNVSATTARPVPAQDPLHTQMETLEAQLLSKVMALEKERSSLSSSSHKQQQAVEKELSALQDRVAELEHGASAYSPPDAFKINIPVKNNYMYARVRRTLPELYAFTICMWLKSKSGGMGIGTPFSYSVPGQSNEMVLLEAGHDPMEMLINDKVAQLPLNLKDGRWHHICIAWTTRDGLWSAYQDGQLRGSSDNLAAWHPIKPHGVIILGQEQDTLGGRFDATQAFVGEIAQFSLWDHILTPAQILGIANCTSPLLGNIIPWDDKLVEAFGGAAKMPFDSCKSKAKAKAKV